ncbi:tash protein pest motif family [Burkholderia pseudomallei]|nr:tash protein pest motif family [Burkholderia pseudomallei]CAJ9324874.1 tash protein pest motif family [Burkholderia pseudomallei]CAJ9378577.1 tash protein pest motif family [Burkholderia pseudomallei]VBP77131.1 chromosome segregation ATPase [Burkholderia pseudomallei]
MELDSDATLLLVVLNPVDSEFRPATVDVDNDATVLFVVDKPVDNEPMLLLALERPVDVDVDSDAMLLFAVDNPVVIAWFVAYSSEPFTASVEPALT